MAILFHNKDVEFNLNKKNLHKSWIRESIASHERVAGSLSFIFTTNPGLREMNRKYLNHDYFTDVITFDYTEGNCISGDIFISVDQVRINAKSYDQDFNQELRRVMIHGILHLIGFEDADLEQQKRMRKMENDALHLWLKEEKNDSGI